MPDFAPYRQSLRGSGGGGFAESETLNPPTTTTTKTTEALARALADRGVRMAGELARSASPDLIGAWCAYAERQRHMGPGALVDGIRSGTPPPATAHRPGTRGQAAYGEQIRQWLKGAVPEVCDPEPHYAAVAAVIRLHYLYGKGSLTARAHGAVIRAAVLAAEKVSGEGEGS